MSHIDRIARAVRAMTGASTAAAGIAFPATSL